MKATTRNTNTMGLLDRAVIGTLLLLAMLLFGIQAAHAVEIVPSIGIAMPSDGGDTKTFAGLAIRNGIVPMLKSELAVSYRNESAMGGDLHVKSWPVTASLYLTPIPTLYAGAGVGWYQTSADYKNSLVFTDSADRRFGMHVGGGFSLPLGPMAGLDLNARYVKFGKDNAPAYPTTFNQDYWSTSLGVVLKL